MKFPSTLLVHRVAQLGLLGMAAACGQGESFSQAKGSVSERDSAGIAIIETPGAAARAPIGWTVDTIPDLQLGGVAAEEPQQFHLIGGTIGRFVGGYGGGITGLSDGRIVVLNKSSGELRFFDADGRFLNRAGGLGNGPGEFRDPIFVPYVSSDSLLIQDFKHRRFTLYSSDGQGYRNFLPNGLAATGQAVTGQAVGASLSGMLTMMSSTPPPGPFRRSIPTTFSWIDLESGRGEIVAEFEKLVYTLPPYYALDGPFTAPASAAMDATGFFIPRGDAPEIREFDTSGRLIRIFRVDEAPRPVKPEDADAVIDFQVNRYHNVPASEIRGVFARMDFPEHWPAFQFVRVDRLGWIWAELFRLPHDKTQQWMIFEPSGVARGILELPVGLEVHDIGRDYVLGRWVDADRVEYVRRYRLDRQVRR